MEAKTKIFIISNMYPSNELPRYGIFVKNFEEKLQQYDVSTTVKAVMTNSPNLSSSSKFVKYMKLYSQIIVAGIFRNSSYDLIYTHYPLHVSFPVLLLALFKKKIILNFHGSDIIPDTPLKKVLFPVQRGLVKKSLAIVVPSDYYKSKIIEIFDYPEDKIWIYPSGGINLKLFYKKKQIHIPTKNSFTSGAIFNIGFISNLITSKGWEVFLDALHNIHKENNIRFQGFMIGDGPDKDRIITKINNLDLNKNVLVIDSIQQKELVNYYNKFDVFIFPTLRTAESLGLVGLESMACGTVVIGSNIAGLKGYIDDGINGLFFQPGDSEELTNKIKLYYYMSNAEKEKMQDNAVSTAQKFDSELVTKVLAERLNNVVNGSYKNF